MEIHLRFKGTPAQLRVVAAMVARRWTKTGGHADPKLPTTVSKTWDLGTTSIFWVVYANIADILAAGAVKNDKIALGKVRFLC